MSKTPITDAIKLTERGAAGLLEDYAILARRLESDRAALVEALSTITRIDAGLQGWHADAMPEAMTRARALLAKIGGSND